MIFNFHLNNFISFTFLNSHKILLNVMKLYTKCFSQSLIDTFIYIKIVFYYIILDSILFYFVLFLSIICVYSFKCGDAEITC